MAKNSEFLSMFFDGMSFDKDNHSEEKTTYQYGLNGRLYSKDGTISFSSVKGDIRVYHNKEIKKILGYYAFKDELILIVKTRVKIELNQSEDDLFDINQYDNSLVCDQDVDEIDLSYLFDKYKLGVNDHSCSVIDEDDYPDQVDYDTIISIKKNEAGNLTHIYRWSGKLGFKMNSKIVTHAIHENIHYKRVYFTDYRTPFRVVNISDQSLSQRSPKELETFQNSSLLEPIVNEVSNGGSLASMTAIYFYRLITENGQVTEFSPASRPVRVLDEYEGTQYAGGSPGKNTGKKVELTCYLLDYENYEDIELIAVEYLSENIPSHIRNLGKKKTSSVVNFTHIGNELSFDPEINISELLARKNNWRYCSSLESSRNMLFSSALRNDPNPLNDSQIRRDFALKSWDENRKTFDCLMNPKPREYRWITTNPTPKLYNVKSKLFTKIFSFGSTQIKLVNSKTGFFYTYDFETDKVEYVNIIPIINNWIQSIDQNEFIVNFPNLKVSFNGSFLAFSKTNNNDEHDIEYYSLEFSNKQVFCDFYEKYTHLDSTINGVMINGAVSMGFYEGNGIRISFKIKEDPLMNDGFEDIRRNENLIELEAPIDKMGVMKGEIYRLAIQFKDKRGYDLFAIPIGDIMTPSFGEVVTYIDENGEGISNGKRDLYTNSIVRENEDGTKTLYARRLVMCVEVRLSCELKRKVSSYKIVYVERTEGNRTVLCQGISAPLERYNQVASDQVDNMNVAEELINKWLLPFNGGPTYDSRGFEFFDEKGENFEELTSHGPSRVFVHRRLGYFDSPDIIYDRVSVENIKNYKLFYCSRVKTDHDEPRIRNTNHSQKQFPINQIEGFYMPLDLTTDKKSFSKKIYLYKNESEYPGFFKRSQQGKLIMGDEHDQETPLLVNFSVFSDEKSNVFGNFFQAFNNYDHKFRFMKIEGSKKMGYGEVRSGADLNLKHQLSNNAMCLFRQAWFYDMNTRYTHDCDSASRAKQEMLKTNRQSKGYSTLIIKTEEDLYVNSLIGDPFYPSTTELLDVERKTPMHQNHFILNLALENDESVYGGKSDFAFANNVYVSFSDTIPVIDGDNDVQRFETYGDVYCTLYVRTKNDFGENLGPSWNIRDINVGSCGGSQIGLASNKKGAWMYAVVLETQVQERMTHHARNYRTKEIFDFRYRLTENMNTAYFQKNTLTKYLPKPYNFKEDINMENLVAVSDVKLTGDYIDSWTEFKVNNFYELEKDKGPALNMANVLGEIYVIQGNQTSVININERSLVPSTDGRISIVHGMGDVISDHKAISDFGTFIRRSVVNISSNDQKIGGFVFFDENKKELIKVSTPLLVFNFYHLEMVKRIGKKIIVDLEGYYDDKYKETNMRIRYSDGTYDTISYNELFQKLNGYYEYNHDIYMNWDSGIYVPKESDPTTINKLNDGQNLIFSGKERVMKIGVVINEAPNSTKIFKHWAAILNTKFNVKKISVTTSNGQNRVVLGSHHMYKNREGRHSVPLKNANDFDDLRGEWAYLEVEIEYPLNDERKDINIFSFINFVRGSYQ